MPSLPTLQIGSSGPMTELLQLSLTRASFIPGAIDGIFGPQTFSAVMRFQSANGLQADGIVGPLTWNALRPYLTGFVLHTIVPGDTIYNIARRYNTSMGAITTANPGLVPNNLLPGTVVTVPLAFDVVPTNISFSSVVLDFCMEGLRARYPFFRTGRAGSSVMGKPLYTITLGSGGNQVFYNASHHANEWITSTLLMKFAENYSKAYTQRSTIFGSDARRLFETTTLHMMPMVNPDGVDLVTGVLTSGTYFDQARSYAANYPQFPFPEGWKANISGIDPNLQYPAGWEIARGIKYAQGFVSPAPRDFVGYAPLTAPESMAAYNYTTARNFTLTLSYHTQGQVIYWQYLDFLPPNSYEIAQRFSQVSGYAVAETPYESGHAGYKDWFIYQYNLPGYTIEAGIGASPLPISQFDEIYRDNIGILVLGLTVTA